MLHRNVFERDYASIFDHYGTGTTVWGPIAGGILSGKYNDGKIPENTRFTDQETAIMRNGYYKKIGWRSNNGVDMLKGLAKIAEELNCTQAQLALAWVLVNKDVTTALFGANNLKQFDDNIQALKVVEKLDSNVLNRIEEVLVNRPTPETNFRTFTPHQPRR